MRRFYVAGRRSGAPRFSRGRERPARRCCPARLWSPRTGRCPPSRRRGRFLSPWRIAGVAASRPRQRGTERLRLVRAVGRSIRVRLGPRSASSPPRRLMALVFVEVGVRVRIVVLEYAFCRPRRAPRPASVLWQRFSPRTLAIGAHVKAML